MSNALAIAGVSAVLKDLLDNALVGHKEYAPVTVSVLSPDRAETQAQGGVLMNLFLYHLAPNSGWRNAALPSYDSRGQRVTNPPLALDLHYMLTAYGKEAYDAEILLGYAMQLLHETPILTRAAIRKALGPTPSAVGGDLLPDDFKKLSAAELADQVEQIKVSWQPLGTEEMSKLWTAFQVKYRPSVAYLATVVLIEAQQPTRTPLPVLSRGQINPVTGYDQGAVVQSNLLPPFPTLLAIRVSDCHPAAQPGTPAPANEPADTIHLLGHHLGGKSHEVTLTHPRLDLQFKVTDGAVTISPPPSRKALLDGTETFELPDEVLRTADTRVKIEPGQDWAPGVYTVELSLIRPGESVARTANALPLAIAPRIRFDSPNEPQVVVERELNGKPTGKMTVTLHCVPPVRTGQRLALIVADQELPGTAVFDDPSKPTPTDKLEFTRKLPDSWVDEGMLDGGKRHLVRLRVDGVESIFIKRRGPDKAPEFDTRQYIKIP